MISVVGLKWYYSPYILVLVALFYKYVFKLTFDDMAIFARKLK